MAQIKIKKPEITIEKPKIGGNSNDKPDLGLKNDPSGLFKKVTDDPSAEHHRKTAVKNLETLESIFKQSSINYDELTKLLFENERTLGHIKKLEPNVDAEKYNERYLPLKDRADKENAIYAQVVEIEKLFNKEFSAPTEMQKYDPLSFRTDSYGMKKSCYCRTYEQYTKTFTEFDTKKAEYQKLTAQLVGYKDADTEKLFENMNTCLINGNQYAIWASTENLEKDVIAYATKEQIAEPKLVIKRCVDYIKALERIETDYSLNLDEAAKTALKTGNEKILKVKTEAETYISSGKYQAYLDKVHAEKIAKVFLPKAVTSNPNLEQGALNYIKGTEYNEYLKNNTSTSQVASVVKAITLTKEPYVKKNDYGIPLYQYHELWVSYKGKDGKCYITAVYASYTYKGGGVYASTPTWGADYPQEMGCQNLGK